MPRIDAPTVREHRENVRRRLIDAAEEIIRRDGLDALSAGAVTKGAGIARSSIYRYVDSVDDLRGLVLARYLPQWMGAVAARLDEVEPPLAKILVWCRANLEQAAVHGHGWLMELGRRSALGVHEEQAVQGAHRDATDVLAQQWRALLGENARGEEADVLADLTRGLVEGGFRSLDRGAEVALVAGGVEVAVRALAERSAAS